MKCNVCGSIVEHSFDQNVLHVHEVSYYFCASCGFIQTAEPYWLDEAYSDAIAIADTGLVMRNVTLASKLAALLYFCFEPREAYLDVAGGYGMLTRLMRDYGFDFYWDDKYCPNLLARGFEVDKSVKPFVTLTAFEVLEHVHDPVTFIREMLSRHNCRTLIFSTELYEGDEPPAKDWWYYAFNTGQHVSFYQRRTLERIAKELNLNFYSVHGLHILTERVLKMGFLLRLTMGKLAPLATLFIQRRLGSRTLADHFRLMGEVEKSLG